MTRTGVTYFYPRSPCGERPAQGASSAETAAISILALLAESDHLLAAGRKAVEISIHALLAESDGSHMSS